MARSSTHKTKAAPFPKALYNARARIEQAVGKLKRFKRVALGLTFILVESVDTAGQRKALIPGLRLRLSHREGNRAERGLPPEAQRCRAVVRPAGQMMCQLGSTIP